MCCPLWVNLDAHSLLSEVEIETLTEPCASTGEKMNETEIDALMAGQEDENGSVHYEGKPFVFQVWFLS